MTRRATVGALMIALLALVGLAVLIIFWPGQKEQKSVAVFSYLQFCGTLALVLLTFIYVNATQRYVEVTQQQITEQNRQPKIRVISCFYPQVNPFVTSFEVEIANPSIKTTSIAIKEVNIDAQPAREIYFEVCERHEVRLAVPARDLLSVRVKADFGDSIPILWAGERKPIAALVFEDVYHGILEPVRYQM